MEEAKRTRCQQADDTKRHLFEVAFDLLQRKGYEDIKVRDIVEEAQVSIGTFYNYYTTKLDVFYETYQLADDYFEEVVAPMLTQPTARERVVAFFNEYARYSSEITDLSLTKVLYNSGNKCFRRQSPQGIHRVLKSQVQWGLDLGEFHCPGGVDELENFLFVAARGLVYDWCTQDGSFSLCEAMIPYVERLLIPFL